MEEILIAAMRHDHADVGAMAALADLLLESDDERQRLRGEALAVLVAGGNIGNAWEEVYGGYWPELILDEIDASSVVATTWYSMSCGYASHGSLHDPINHRLALMESYAAAPLLSRRRWAKRTLSKATGYTSHEEATKKPRISHEVRRRFSAPSPTLVCTTRRVDDPSLGCWT